jgi:starch-binding outer membrane protein, SusD/RagB family
MIRMHISNAFFLLLAGTLLGLFSCKKDSLLNQTPPTTLNDASFWKTAGDLQNYMNNFYSNGNIFPLYIENFSLAQFQIDDNSDNMVNKAYNSRNNGENTLSSNGGYADWGDIRDANYFLANYQRVLSYDTWTDIESFVGEAYFFRALLYFQGLQNYGGLPWINKPLNVNDTALLYAQRLPRNITVDSIVQDLNNAIAFLPVKAKAQRMRIYREYAQAFKARVCLYEGTWEKYHANDAFGVAGQNGQKYLQMAADAADSVISSGTFGLDNVGVYNGYWELFNQTDYSSSREIIFWAAENFTIAPSGAYSGGNTTQSIFQSGSGGGGGNTGLAKSMVNDYLCTDGNPIGTSPLYEGDDSLAHVVANRDPRLRQTIDLPGDTMVLNTPVSLYTLPSLLTNPINTTGFQLYKGLNTDPKTNANNGRNGPVPGIIYMRYAEVLLTYAEARAELGTITQSDLDQSINLLRDRVGMPHLILASIAPDPNWLFPNLSPIINEVRRERRVELACEGFRFNDICRWAAAGSLIKGMMPSGAQINQYRTVNFAQPGASSPLYLVVGSNIFTNNQGYISPYANIPQVATGYKFNTNRDYLLPIDQTDMTINPNLQQNPGWQ